MHEKIGFNDAMTKLADILRRVEAGEHFTITNRGNLVADLVPSRSDTQRRVEGAIANILKARKHVTSDKKLQQLKTSGRK